MNMFVDEDVQDVLCFLRHWVPIERRVGVAQAAAKLAEMMWSGFPKENVFPLYFTTPVRADWPVREAGRADGRAGPTGTAKANGRGPKGC